MQVYRYIYRTWKKEMKGRRKSRRLENGVKDAWWWWQNRKKKNKFSKETE